MQYRAEDVAERLQVEDVVVRLFVATDERDWPTVDGCFTDPLTLDMTSMAGGAPAQMKPSELSAAWAAGFEPLDHVAVKSRSFVGSYAFTLAKAGGRWRISLLKFNLKFIEGNVELEKAV